MLSRRLTCLDETFAAADGTQRQNRGAVATGSNVPKTHDTAATRYVSDDPFNDAAHVLSIMFLECRSRSTWSLPLRGSDVELSPMLSGRLTCLDETFAAAGNTQRQN